VIQTSQEISMTFKLRLAATAGLMAALVAGPALAGPAGSGLAHTEEVARKRAAETVRLTAPSRDCVPAAVAALREHDAVKAVEAADLKIKVRTDGKAARDGELQSLVSKTCATAPSVAAS